MRSYKFVCFLLGNERQDNKGFSEMGVFKI